MNFSVRLELRATVIVLDRGIVPYFHWRCLPSSNSEEIWGAKKISLHGRERHPAGQITDLRRSATLSCPLECTRFFYYKKLGSGHRTKSFLISHEILSILVLKVS